VRKTGTELKAKSNRQKRYYQAGLYVINALRHFLEVLMLQLNAIKKNASKINICTRHRDPAVPITVLRLYDVYKVNDNLMNIISETRTSLLEI
jgi:hypothetical protein